MARFMIDKYGVLEINRAAFLKNGLVVSQTPLSDEFTAEAPCENGMWVDANKANGEIKLPSAQTAVYGIVYTTEKDYTGTHPALKNFCQVAGDYPRVGILHEGDTFTTNVFNYEFSGSTVAEQKAELVEKLAEGALYVVPTTGNGAPTLTAEKPATGAYGQVMKVYTVPAGTPGIKYVMLRV